MFAYDNNTFVVQSFLPTEVTVTVSVSGTGAATGLTDLLSGQTISPAPRGGGGGGGRGGFGGGFGGRGGSGVPGTSFAITIPPHSYRPFAVHN